MKERVFHGKYPVRKLSRGERGIHLPTAAEGAFGIYEEPNGNFTLEKIKGAGP